MSHLNPTPSFPSYTGPYHVGSTDVEIPASELPSPSSIPVSNISTVNFRIFYPSERPAKQPGCVYWLPDPQQEYLGAYVRFLGASHRLSAFIRSRNLSKPIGSVIADFKLQKPTFPPYPCIHHHTCFPKRKTSTSADKDKPMAGYGVFARSRRDEECL